MVGTLQQHARHEHGADVGQNEGPEAVRRRCPKRPRGGSCPSGWSRIKTRQNPKNSSTPIPTSVTACCSSGGWNPGRAEVITGVIGGGLPGISLSKPYRTAAYCKLDSQSRPCLGCDLAQFFNSSPTISRGNSSYSAGGGEPRTCNSRYVGRSLCTRLS